MSVEKWWNEIGGRGKREKPHEKPTQTPFCLPRNPHGGTETRTRDPSGGRRAPNCLRHEAATIQYIYRVIYELSYCKKISHLSLQNAISILLTVECIGLLRKIYDAQF